MHERPRANCSDRGEPSQSGRDFDDAAQESQINGLVSEAGVAEAAADLAAAPPESIGWFRFYFDDQRWYWSDQLQRLHGYQPGTVTPTTELVLSHKHPDDRDKVAAVLEDITQTRGVFSSRHRIVDADGRVHAVVVVGGQFFDAEGNVIGTNGFYVDLTAAERLREEEITARLGEIAQNRAAIEQVKGMLILIYDVEEDVAFGLLRSLSQEVNVKLRRLAEQLAADLRAVARGAIPDRTAFDYALVDIHRRLTGGSN